MDTISFNWRAAFLIIAFTRLKQENLYIYIKGFSSIKLFLEIKFKIILNNSINNPFCYQRKYIVIFP